MKIELRNNQIKPVEEGIKFFKQKNPEPSIIVMPTAAGKSIIISSIAKELDGRVLVIQPSKLLLEQNLEKLRMLGGDASIYSASMNTKEIGDVTYATIGSIKNIGETFKNEGFKYMIVDEIHAFPREAGGMLRKFLSASGIMHVLGLTATPLKLQTNSNGFGDNFSKLVILTSRSKKGNFFKKIIHICQVKEMIENKYWSPLEYEAYNFDTGQLVYNSTKADFTEDSLNKAYKDQNIEQKIINRIKTLDRKSIIVAVPSVAAARSLAEKIPNAAAVWGNMPPKERDYVVGQFRELRIRCIVQVNTMSLGFDHALLDCLICGRPTASLAWWYQFIGRLVRIHPEKKDGLVIDFSGNFEKFGKIEHLRFEKENIWKLYGENGTLLTGIPLHEIGMHKELTSEDKLNPILDFGMHRGKRVNELPTGYMKWMLKDFTFNKHNKHIKEAIERKFSNSELVKI